MEEKNAMSRIFKRKIYDKMLDWKRRRQGSTALLIKGARRIGKSTVCRAFAEAEYESYILIDFLNPPSGVKELFDDLSDMNFFFLRLSTLYGVKLYEKKASSSLTKCRGILKLVRL